MAKDIVPDLLKSIESEFKLQTDQSKKVRTMLEKLKEGVATYEEAHDYAQELGDILSLAFRNNLSVDVLPDGKMYYNIADRIVSATLKNSYELVSDYSAEVQTLLNQTVGYTIKGQKAPLNEDKIVGIVDKLSDSDDFEMVKWLLDEVIVNFTESVVDETIETNARFLQKTGVPSTVVRVAEARCCSWCDGLDGVYNYPDEVPAEAFQRHRHCRCKTLYYPGDRNKFQDVWDKTWSK